MKKKKDQMLAKLITRKLFSENREPTFGPFPSMCYYTRPEAKNNFQVAGVQKNKRLTNVSDRIHFQNKTIL